MVNQEEKIAQAKRIGVVAEEVLAVCVRNAKNRQEARAAIQGALEILSTFPQSPEETLQEDA